MKSFGLVTTVLMLTATAANAAQMPTYEIMDYCQKTFEGDQVSECVTQERHSFIALRREWNSLPDSVRETCVTEVTEKGEAYVDLAACIEKAGD